MESYRLFESFLEHDRNKNYVTIKVDCALVQIINCQMLSFFILFLDLMIHRLLLVHEHDLPHNVFERDTLLEAYI
jgi:hypothetical protein